MLSSFVFILVTSMFDFCRTSANTRKQKSSVFICATTEVFEIQQICRYINSDKKSRIQSVGRAISCDSELKVCGQKNKLIH